MDAFQAGYIMGILLFVLLLLLIPGIFFLLTQQNTLKAIRRENRTMSPGEVWLQLIPLFNIVWCFIVVNRIAESIRRELMTSESFSFEQNQPQFSGYSSAEKPTQQIGIAMCVLNCTSAIPFIGFFSGIAAFVCWIIYWVKLSEYKSQIQNKNYMHLDSIQQSNYQQF